MKRTTILLPDDLAYLVDRERSRRGVSTAQVVREAVAAHFNVTSEPRRLGIIGLGRSSIPDLAENDEHYLAEGWGSAEFFERTMGYAHDAPIDGKSPHDSAATEVDDTHAADPGGLKRAGYRR